MPLPDMYPFEVAIFGGMVLIGVMVCMALGFVSLLTLLAHAARALLSSQVRFR